MGIRSVLLRGHAESTAILRLDRAGGRNNEVTMHEFPRIRRLPAYVFNITGELKAAARRRGEDIIDFGMGNPDGATPQHIVDKMVEAARRPETHRYSLSRGIPRLRRAITKWYDSRYGVSLDPDTEAIILIGEIGGGAEERRSTEDRSGGKPTLEDGSAGALLLEPLMLLGDGPRDGPQDAL